MQIEEQRIPSSALTSAPILRIHLTRWREITWLIVVDAKGRLHVRDVERVSESAEVSGGMLFELDSDKAEATSAESTSADADTAPQSIDWTAQLEIAAHEQFIAVCNVHGTHGVVVDLSRPNWRLSLRRGDYRVKNCTFPLAFLERNGQAMLLHATDWNRLDITNLETEECLTEREMKHGKGDDEGVNYLDYFHSKLHMAPDHRHFLSNGWVWQPWDCIMRWSVEGFLTGFESTGESLHQLENSGYNWDRPCAFVDASTIAWAYNARESGEDDVAADAPTELVFQDIHTKEITQRIKFEYLALTDSGEAHGELEFDVASQVFIASSPGRGTVVAGLDGALLHSTAIPAVAIAPNLRTFGCLDEGDVVLTRWAP